MYGKMQFIHSIHRALIRALDQTPRANLLAFDILTAHRHTHLPAFDANGVICWVNWFRVWADKITHLTFAIGLCVCMTSGIQLCHSDPLGSQQSAIIKIYESTKTSTVRRFPPHRYEVTRALQPLEPRNHRTISQRPMSVESFSGDRNSIIWPKL